MTGSSRTAAMIREGIINREATPKRRIRIQRRVKKRRNHKNDPPAAPP
jgi:hypothetical protein